MIARDSLGSHYESKVLELDDSKDKIKYLVHYDGWNSRWDEWITGERMMKLTEENKVICDVLLAAGMRGGDLVIIDCVPMTHCSLSGALATLLNILLLLFLVVNVRYWQR